jgi:two-component system LytT family sensor kinase
MTVTRAGPDRVGRTASMRPIRLAQVVFLLATPFVVLFTVQGVYAGGISSMRQLLTVFGWQAVPWYLWVGLVFPAFALLDRLGAGRGSLPRTLGVDLALGLSLAFVHAVLVMVIVKGIGLVPSDVRLGDLIRNGIKRSAVTSLVQYGLVAIGYHLVRMAIDYRRSQETVERREEQLAAARLEALRRQLQPHFLFNALNAAAAAARTGGGAAAADLIAALGDLLRRAIDLGNRQQVRLDEELDFLDRFLLIQQARFAERLTVRLDVAPESLAASVPPLLVQTLVENAIKHGIERIDRPGEVIVRSSVADDRLSLSVTNDGPRPARVRTTRNGTGVANARARLKELYGDRAELTLKARTDAEGMVATVDLPLELPEAAGSRSASSQGCAAEGP